jgi:hypothetical protein
MSQSRHSSKEAYCIAFLMVFLIVILISATRWIGDHPSPTNWDEADYFNNVLSDQASVQKVGLRGFRWTLVYNDRLRPPAYRVVAMPFFALFDFTPGMARAISLGCHWAGLAIVYLTMRKLVSPQCSVLSVLILCLSPDVLIASIAYYTEHPLFLATTGFFYFLISSFESAPGCCRSYHLLSLQFQCCASR